MIEILNEGNFDEKVLQSSGNVLVEFFATWCPHCQRMMPIINEVADRVQGQAVVYQVTRPCSNLRAQRLSVLRLVRERPARRNPGGRADRRAFACACCLIA